jgi:hypothetical protein
MDRFTGIYNNVIDRILCIKIPKYNEDVKLEQMQRINALSHKMVEIGLMINMIIVTLVMIVFAENTGMLFTIILLIGASAQLYKYVACLISPVSKYANNYVSSLEVWFESHLLLWYQWVIYSFGYYVARNVGSVSSTIHVLITLLVYCPASAAASHADYGTTPKSRILTAVVMFLSVLPVKENNMLFSLWRSTLRVVMSSIIYALILLRDHDKKLGDSKAIPLDSKHTFDSKHGFEPKHSFDRDVLEKAIKAQTLRVYIALYYIFFGRIEVSAIYFIIHAIVSIYKAIQNYSFRHPPEEDVSVDEEEEIIQKLQQQQQHKRRYREPLSSRATTATTSTSNATPIVNIPNNNNAANADSTAVDVVNSDEE